MQETMVFCIHKLPERTMRNDQRKPWKNQGFHPQTYQNLYISNLSKSNPSCTFLYTKKNVFLYHQWRVGSFQKPTISKKQKHSCIISFHWWVFSGSIQPMKKPFETQEFPATSRRRLSAWMEGTMTLEGLPKPVEAWHGLDVFLVRVEQVFFNFGVVKKSKNRNIGFITWISKSIHKPPFVLFHKN